MDRPNVLVFITHDTGRHLGCYGIDQVHSPSIDRIASEGMRFNHFYATAAMCSPSRAAMFSGLYPQTNGVMGLTHSPWYWKYHDFSKHISHYFKDAGYKTVAAGVIHEVYHHEILGELAFEDHLVGNQTSNIIANVPPKLEELAQSEQPFYLQIGTFQTHSPYNADDVGPDDSKGVYVPPQYLDNDSARKQFAELQGSIRHVDKAVESVLNALEKNGLTDNTIVVFTVDHGIAFARSKTTLYDPGISTALLMRWPAGGITNGQVSDHLLNNVDLTPTLLELAGVPVPDGLQGTSFADICRDPQAGPVRDAIFAQHTHPSQHPDTRCIRTKKWKLIRNFFPCRNIPIPIDLGKPLQLKSGPEYETRKAELYDLENDPLETTNLADDPAHSETLKQLNQRLLEHMQTVGDPILEGPIRWPYYESSLAMFQQTAD